MPITVFALYLHPVKSARAVAVSRASLDQLGFVDDRRFLVVDATGRFITQRDTPVLAHLDARPVDGGGLRLVAPGMPSLDAAGPTASSPTREVTVWRDTVHGADLGDDAAAWLSSWLQKPARLVGIGPGFSRPMRKAIARPGDEVSFADAHPLLIISEASLDDLNARLDSPLPMDRFRPNIVVRGAGPYAEDGWKRIRIGDVVLRASGPCARCVVTTTDQATLERGKEPLRTLAAYRRGAEGEVWFGQNYIHETKAGELAVGTPVEVLE